MSPEEITSRVATVEDEPFLRQLFYTVRSPEFAAAGLRPEELEALLRQQYSAMRAYYLQVFPETEYRILEDRGRPIGYEALRDSNELHLIDIALVPEYRCRGIGTARLRLLQSKAEEARKCLLLSVEIFNPAKRLYERLGFSVTEESGIYQRMTWIPAPLEGGER